MPPLSWVAGAVYAAGLLTVLAATLRRSRHVLGPADRITLARAALVGVVLALVAGRTTAGPTLVAVASVALVLDGVDGKVARRTRTSSSYGARFDMEVDAFLILVLSVHAAYSLGAWTLVIGGMRYAFVAASWAAPWLRGALPPSLARKTVAASQGIFLVAAGSGLLPYVLSAASVATALTLLTWSFGRDIAWLWLNGEERQRHAAGRGTAAGATAAGGATAGGTAVGGTTGAGVLARLARQGRDQIRGLARARPRRRAGTGVVLGGEPGHRDAGVPRRRATEPVPGDASPVPGGRFPRAA
ncbi:CDP-alcohol phosphatidyltransferase family protein [Actinomadura barringtoniae]|uniref:CDP-alcohol phosphatidyltransferase family protein n=1 Tax=Actinomadura barringtoniae TaxID=1427535 RepID=UPI0027DB9394|nr:CDP-alcohol phosphatidyltransferase family protein [Actinomadura barringtoniae]